MQNLKTKLEAFELVMEQYENETVNIILESPSIQIYQIYENFDLYNYQGVEFVFTNKQSDTSEGSIKITDIIDILIEYNFDDQPYQVEVVLKNDLKILFQTCNCE